LNYIKIERNYFMDEPHDFPEVIPVKNVQEAENLAAYYKKQLEAISDGNFTVDCIEHTDHIALNCSLIKRPKLKVHKELQFTISGKESLQEFWNYFKDDTFAFRLHECLENIIYMFYAVSAFRLKQKHTCTIKIQECNNCYILSIINVNGFPKKSMYRLLNYDHQFKELVQDNEYNFFVSKDKQCQSKEIFLPLKEDSRSIKFQSFNDETLEIFSFLEVYEIDELIELMGEFNSMLLILGNELENDEAMLIVHKLKAMSKILITSYESYNIGVQIDNMGREIERNFEKFLALGAGMVSLCNAFNRDLTTWIKKLFFEGAPSLHFLDESLISNCLTICQMLQPEDESQVTDTLDDIFDF